MKKLIVIALLVVCGSTEIFSQIEQGRRARMRMDAALKSAEDREHDKRLEEEGNLPVPKAAVMNVDVQMVLSKADHKTFAEAKAAEAKKIVDGDPLWLYVKFKGKLGDYVITSRHPEDREKLRYTLYIEVAPKGDVTALHQYTIQFAKEDLAAPELKINLAPGVFGRNKSLPIFLATSRGVKSGIWSNELRLTNNVAVPRMLTSNLATAGVTLDFSGGLVKYKKMDSEYDSVILRGTTDPSKLPVPGTFFSDSLKALIAEKLSAEQINPLKIYFSGDDWQEYSSSALGNSRTRRVFATYTYRQAEQCFYGVAEAVENFDFMQGKFGEAEIKLQKDLPARCEEVN